MIETKQARSFIAIPLSDPLLSAAIAIQNHLKQSLSDVRWTKPESMHLTLHFFGEMGEESLEKAGSVMVSIESLFSPFTMTLARVGAFPSPDRAQLFWLGVKSGRLTELHSTLAKRLRESGFPCEKRLFKPHITLGRCRGGPQLARHILSLENDSIAGEMTVSSLVLFESTLLPSGAIHKPRQTSYLTTGSN